MKGKYAARATLRRESEAAAEITRLRAELASERECHNRETEALKGQVTALNSEIRQRARSLADAAIEKRQAELEKALKDRGLSFDLLEMLHSQKDKLIYNACRYISMTTGKNSLNALVMVWTWFTEVDCYGLPLNDKTTLYALGLPRDGWVAYMLRQLSPHAHPRRTKQRVAANTPLAHTLDQVAKEPEKFPQVHPGWQKVKHQYMGVTYRNSLELQEEDGSVTVIK